jgi:hypothetical protein
VAKGVFDSERLTGGKEMLVHVVSMLCGLIDRFDEGGCRCHEDMVEYGLHDRPIQEERKSKSRRKRKI